MCFARAILESKGSMADGSLPVVSPQKQIRFVNSEGQPPAKRRRVNAA